MRGPRPRAFGRVNWRGWATLLWRDLWRTLKSYRDTILGAAVANLLYFAVFLLALGEDERMGGVALAQFLAPGLVVVAACHQAFDISSASILFDKLEGMLADVLMAPLGPWERALGYALSATIGGLVSGAAVFVAFLPFVDMAPADPFAVLFFAGAGALLHANVGILAGLWARKWEHYSAVSTFLVIPFGFLSGAFYSIRALPEAGQRLVEFNPVFYVIDGFRYGFTGQAEGSLATGAVVLLTLDGALLLLVSRLLGRGWRIKP